MKPLVKQKTHFNLVDAIIVLLALAAAVALLFYAFPQTKSGEKASLTVVCTGVRQEFLPLISKGDVVYDQSGASILGTVASVSKKRDSLSLTDPQTDETKTVLYPENTFYELTLVLSATNAVEGDQAQTISLGGVSVKAGQPLSLRTARVSLSGICESYRMEKGGEQ
ncbi:MAG: DUF4330 family protein [Clostridia bacterium]|nr:DUF4330 family protein [Clostridia bacterium]